MPPATPAALLRRTAHALAQLVPMAATTVQAASNAAELVRQARAYSESINKPGV